MAKHTTSQTSHQIRAGGLVLNRMQAGLALGLVGIGVVIAFGGGFIVGMWYQASEQITPYEAASTASSPPPETSKPLTFYSTLTKPVTEPETAPSAPARVDRGEADRPGPDHPRSEPASLRTGEAETAVPALQARRPEPAPPEPTPPEPVRPAPPEPARPVPKPARPASPPPVSARSSEGRYSVQVGSFQSREQAEELRNTLQRKGYATRITPSRLPGKGLWYRVRVGHFADEATASRAAARLKNRERLSTWIIEEAG